MDDPGTHVLEALGAQIASPTRATLLVVSNPHATTSSPELEELVVRALESRYAIETARTQHAGHAIQIGREAAGEGYGAVVAFGGDGTVNEVANGLMGSPTPLAVLPGGATNVFCRMLGLPNDVVDATVRLLRAADDLRSHPVDLGMLDDRAFTFAAGVGLDAGVVAHVDDRPHLKARLGGWYFGAVAAATFLRDLAPTPPRLEVSADGRVDRGVSLFVQNASPYTFFRDRPIDLVPGSALDSGDVSAALLQRAAGRDLPTLSARMLSRQRTVGGHRHVVALPRVGELEVRSLDGRAVPVQVDGDHLGERDAMTIGVRPGALRVLDAR